MLALNAISYIQKDFVFGRFRTGKHEILAQCEVSMEFGKKMRSVGWGWPSQLPITTSSFSSCRLLRLPS